MPGKIYCFNAYNETLSLNVNGFSAGNVAGWSPGGPTLYTPMAIAVPRIFHGADSSSPGFPNDMMTQLNILWPSYASDTSINLMNLPSVSIEDDLILYIAVNQLILMNTDGFVLQTQTLSQANLTEESDAKLRSAAGPVLTA